MQSREIETNGDKIHVRVGGDGPAVVMLHGFGTTGDMWGHLASAPSCSPAAVVEHRTPAQEAFSNKPGLALSLA
jgi:pimeloyl-ACP methyl ester carboxylesterase